MSPFVLTGKRGVGHSFYKSLSPRIILNRTIYFHRSAFSFWGYKVIKLAGNLLFVLILFVILFVALIPLI